MDGSGTVRAAFSDAPTADLTSLETLIQQLLSDVSNGDGLVNMSIKLRLPAGSNDNDEYYFYNEYVISHLDVWLFKADTKEFFTKATISGLTAEYVYREPLNYDITYFFDNFRVPVGIYDIFTIANYPGEPIEAKNEADLLNRIDSITYKEGIEANHDKEMLLNGPYPEHLKRRIVSGNGHLSNRACGETLAENATPALRHVWLCHLSEENNHPELARKTVESILRTVGIVPGVDFQLDVLGRKTPSEVIEL